MADTLKCKCGGELIYQDYRCLCECDKCHKQYSYKEIFDIAIKAEAKLEAVNKRVDGLSVEVIYELIISAKVISGVDYEEYGEEKAIDDLYNLAKAIQSKLKAVK